MKAILSQMMKVIGEAGNRQQVIILGHPLPGVDWWKLVRIFVDHPEVEVSKLIQYEDASLSVGFVWRISMPVEFAARFTDPIPARLDSGRQPDVRPFEITEVVSFKPLDEVFQAADVTVVQDHTVVFGLPKSRDRWKSAVVSLLMGGRAIEVCKSYQPDGGDLSYTWRIILKPGLDRKPLARKRNPGAAPVMQPRSHAAPEVTKEEQMRLDMEREGGKPFQRRLNAWISRNRTPQPDVNLEAARRDIEEYRARVSQVQLDKFGRVMKFPILGGGRTEAADRLRFSGVDGMGMPKEYKPELGTGVTMTIDAPSRPFRDPRAGG